MKHNWSYSTIGVELKTSSGGTPNKMHKEFYEGGNIPWLRSGEVCKKNITETEMFITQKGMDNSSAKWFPENTVLVAMYGATAGQVGILRFPSTTNQAICGIFPNDKFLPEFLYYTLLYSKDTLVSQAVGNAQPNISQIKVKEVPLPKISIEEQQKIVEFLDKEFEKIDTLKANAEKGLQQAKDLLEQYRNNVYDNTVFCPLESTVTVINGYAFNSEDFNQTNTVKVVKITNVGVGVFVETNENKLSTKHLTDNSEYIIHTGDIVFALTRTIISDGLKVAIVPEGYNNSLLNQRVASLRINDEIQCKYLYNYFQTSKVRQYVLSKVNTLMQPNLSIKDLKAMPIPCCDKNEMKQIVSRLDKLNEHCNALQKNYEKTIALCDDMKQALLRKAFNGEL